MFKYTPHTFTSTDVTLIEDVDPAVIDLIKQENIAQKVCITSVDGNTSEHVYNLLVNPLSGDGVLSGSLHCVNNHPLIPNITEFKLTSEQIEAVKQIQGVTRVTNSGVTLKHRYTKLDQVITPAIARATYNGTSNVGPHSIYYTQESKLSFIDQSEILGHSVSLSSIDCSNVDIIIWDSGVDASHPDFVTSGTSRVKLFDWSVFKGVTNAPIVSAMPTSYYTDLDGHGTACASLAAGNKCGMAKKANIYSLKDADLVASTDIGFSHEQCQELLLEFLKAKKHNLHGLNSSYPTIISCSWGAVGPSFSAPIQLVDYETRKFASTFGYGLDSGFTPAALPAPDDVTDAYMRAYLDAGANVVVAANDSNAYESNTLPTLRTGVATPDVPHSTIFSDIDAGGAAKIQLLQYMVTYLHNNNVRDQYIDYSVSSKYLANLLTSKPKFTIKAGNDSYVYQLIGEFNYNYTYGSPNIGMVDVTVGGNTTYTKDNYPLIKVGDVTPIGNIAPNNAVSGLYWSANQAYTAYWLLSNTQFTEPGLEIPLRSGGVLDSYATSLSCIVTEGVSYASPRGPFFIKSNYSGFGPDVDIFAPGNATWAAKSNQLVAAMSWPANDPHNGATLPSVVVGSNEIYQFMNGTSAATPIVAGVLATILSHYPGYTPAQARQRLLESALNGGIMQTIPNYRTVTDTVNGPMNYPAGIWQDPTVDGGKTQPNAYTYMYYVSGKYEATNNLTNLIFFARNFNTNNLIAQAYPLRNIVSTSTTPTLTAFGINYNKTGLTTQMPTTSGF